MKNKLFLIIIMLMTTDVFSQNVCQESCLELSDVMSSQESYLCQATTSITLFPGFGYKPSRDNSMILEIDRYSVFPPTDGYCGGMSSDDDGVVGSLGGAFEVSNTGAAVYSIKIEVPDAIGMVKPELSLVYNSQSSNGVVGWAWDLAGLSSITRTGQTLYHDGKVTDVNFVDDRYLLDGQRLMLIQGSAYGADGAEYKIEIDNMDKIVSYNDDDKSPKSFVVWKSDGSICEYGTTDDSRVEARNDDGIILKWLVSKVYDRNGNTIVFNYDKDVSAGEAYIDNIQYTSNEDAGISPAYKVKFVYKKKRSDVSCGYVNGNMVQNDRLLENILVYNNYTSKLIFDYSLKYYTPGIYVDAQFLYHRLKHVGLTAGDDKINPTRIIWNAEGKHYPDEGGGFKTYQLEKSVFAGNVPFVGDYNGDGYSDILMLPYKIQDTYPNDVLGKVYLNNCNGGFENVLSASLQMSKNIEWVYVVDMNDDGSDDLVLYEFNNNAQTIEDDLVTLHFYMTKDGGFVKNATYRYKNNVSLLPGKYVADDNAIVVVGTKDNSSDKKVDYIRFVGDELVKSDVFGASFLTEIEPEYMAIDMTGDGLSEILMLGENGYKVLKLKDDAYFHFELYAAGDAVTIKSHLFPNDYNGDGKTDLLFYDQSQYWNLIMSKGDSFATSVSCSNTNVLRNVMLSTKDKYRYSLKELQSPSVTIRTADFDGDGVADIAVFKDKAANHYLEIGFKPVVTADGKCIFSKEKRYYMPINYSHQTIHIGRFLPQENVSVLSVLPRNPLNTQKVSITSLYPHSVYYSVERIVDGMGNMRGFSYDYLMQKSKNDDFYTNSNYTTFNGIKKMSIPISALKTDTVFSVNDVPIVNRYEYKNALVHTEGHGFMGLERIVIRNVVNGDVVKKQVRDFDVLSMNTHCVSLPSMLKLYNGENKLLKEEMFVFEKYCCTFNEKVMMPLLTYKYDVMYNPDKQGDVLKLNIIKNEYVSDKQQILRYDRVVSHVCTTSGFTDVNNMVEPEDCLYYEKKSVAYDSDMDSWVINRPIRIQTCKYDRSGDKVGDVKTFVYDDRIPNRIVKETKVPNCDNDLTDMLLLSIEYGYDKVGNVILQSVSTPSISYIKTVKCEYGESYNYRYKTKTFDALGREIISCYHPDYGILMSTMDYNGFVTHNEKSIFGIDDVVVLPDGMVKAKALRWSDNNEHAPSGAAYYVWEKNTASAESMVFYHKSGAELRKVSFDINGDAVYVDKRYDEHGNVVQESLPYYKGDARLFVSNVYDKYNRLVEKLMPDGMLCSYIYDGNALNTECISVDGKRQSKKEVYNMMGWIISARDAGGNEMLYDYYCDGLMKSVAMAGNPNYTISLTYDNARNKKSLCDSNYGLVTYQYDALGKIKNVTNPKGATIDFQYDMLGRMRSRTEQDYDMKNALTTCWLYDDGEGKNGMLKSVVSDNHKIDYTYDDELRLLSTVETIDGDEYITTYRYDQASRVSGIEYPTGLVITKVYSNSGYEKEVYDADDDVLLWKSKATMADGSITEYEYGNGLMTKISYNQNTSMVENIMTYDNDRIIQNLAYSYDGLGNMKNRSKFMGERFCEEFEYDDHNRLVSISLDGVKSLEMDYDSYGNVIAKEDNGVNVLYSTRYDQKRPNAILYAKTDDEKMFVGFNRDMKYSAFDNLVSLSQGDDYLEIDYGCGNDRVSMKSYVDGVNKSKTYVGSSEIVKENGEVKSYTYISGLIGVFAVCEIDGKGEKSLYYIHKDNLGSWDIITNEAAEVIQNVSFDAWGNVRDGQNWGKSVEGTCLMFDRGFTGHEHLATFGLINMNGRIYDPMMSMMLSPDNNIQLPQMSQNFNRYSYCLNNPLSYTDPSGEWVENVVFGVVGGATNLILNADNIDGFGEGALLFGVGFAKGFLAEYTMGYSWLMKVGVQTIMSGVTAGVNKMVAVGDGSFKFSGDDWNSIRTASHYALGSGLVKSVMYTYMTEPSDTQYGESIFESCANMELAHSVTSLAAHGMGCWFSGRPFLTTMKFKDVGFDLKMLGIVAKRLLVSYVIDSEFADKAIRQRACNIKDSMMRDLVSEDADHPDLSYSYEISGACVDKMRLYIVGDVFAILPGEMLEIYPKPYIGEIISFPFSYSLFKTLFFNK